MLIKTDQPSTGKSIILSKRNVPITWYTLYETAHYSIPLTGETPRYADESDADRELLPGEAFISSPLLVTNKDSSHTVSVDVRIINECSVLDVPDDSEYAITIVKNLRIGKNESVQVPIQGMSLLKSKFDTFYGSRLQVKASLADALDVYGSAVESSYPDHAEAEDII